MTIPALPSLDRTSPTFRSDLDTYFLTQLPATTAAFNAEIERIEGLGFGSYSGTSTTSLLIGTGPKSLTLQTGKSFSNGQPVLIANSLDVTQYIAGQILSYNPATGDMSVVGQASSGTGTFSQWSVVLTAVQTPYQPIIGLVGDTITTARTLSAPNWLPLTGATYLKSSYPDLAPLCPFSWSYGGATDKTMPSTADWWNVCYGNGVFVALERTGSNSVKAATSTNGSSWTERTLPSSQNWLCLAYGAGVFVALSAGTGFATSPDGITWTLRTMPALSWHAVTYANGIFVALGGGGSNRSATSTDGIAWTNRTNMPSAASWQAIAYGNGVFVAIASDGSGKAATSTDGVTWAARTMPNTSTWSAIAYGNGIFVATYGGTDNATSPDGITWTLRTQAAGTDYLSSVCFGAGTFISVRTDATQICTSANGVNWTEYVLPSAQSWKAVAYGGEKFVLVSSASNVAAQIYATYDSATQFSVPALTQSPLKNYIKATA